jgi:hypothetical protein
MGNASVPMFCSECQTKLKRQVLGSNIFYYCRNCGCVSSEAYLSEEVKVLHVQKPISAKGASSPLNLLETPESL